MSKARSPRPSARTPVRATIWVLVREFFQARALFLKIYNAYEERVLRHAAERGVDRKDLRLDASAVSALLDTKQLGKLRDRYLWRLKEISHDLFRSEDSTDIFDRYVNEAFHEISILKEEHRQVHRFAPLYSEMEEEEEYKVILDEVHELFPHKVHHVHNLFQKAKSRLEQLIPAYASDTVLMRSLYLFGEDLFAGVYKDGLQGFYAFLYPQHGAVQAYLEVGKSFLKSGFLEQAQESLNRSIAEGEKIHPRPPGVDAILDEARTLLHSPQRVPIPS